MHLYQRVPIGRDWRTPFKTEPVPPPSMNTPSEDTHLCGVRCHARALAGAGGLFGLGAVVGCLGDGGCLA